MPEFVPALAANGVAATKDIGGGELVLVSVLGIDVSGDYIADDWNDGTLSANSTRTGYQEQIFLHPASNEAGDAIIGATRPNWDVANGTFSGIVSGRPRQDISADGGVLLRTSTDLYIGAWEFVWRYSQLGNNADRIDYIFWGESLTSLGNQTNAWRTSLSDDGDATFNLSVGKFDSGTLTTVISNTIADNTNDNIQQTTRDSNGSFEFVINSISQGTAVDSYVPPVNYTGVLFHDSAGTSIMEIDNLLIG